jgi:hypothetical protein
LSDFSNERSTIINQHSPISAADLWQNREETGAAQFFVACDGRCNVLDD